jgi:hypothetical protein
MYYYYCNFVNDVKIKKKYSNKIYYIIFEAIAAPSTNALSL